MVQPLPTPCPSPEAVAEFFRTATTTFWATALFGLVQPGKSPSTNRPVRFLAHLHCRTELLLPQIQMPQMPVHMLLLTNLFRMQSTQQLSRQKIPPQRCIFHWLHCRPTAIYFLKILLLVRSDYPLAALASYWLWLLGNLRGKQ